MLSLLILAPLFATMFINLPIKGMKKIAFWLVLLLAILQTCFAIVLNTGLGNMQCQTLNYFFNLKLVVDGLSVILLLTIGIIMFVTLSVAKDTIHSEEETLNFASLLLVILTGMNGLVMVRDIFSLYVFMEVISISSFILIAFNKKRDAFEGAFKYIILSAVATVLMLTSIALIVLISGNTSFDSIRDALRGSPYNVLISFAVAIFLSGLFIKSGLVPFHGWVADAYSTAPAAVSVLLAGIVTKTVGIYTLIRIIDAVFGFTGPIKNILLLAGTASILLGAFAALGQNNFKRMLAYSSISQMGYIAVALGCGTMLGTFAAVFHLFNHAIFKSLLFVNSASIESSVGTQNMKKLGGLSYQMPVTGATSAVACLSTAGIPPLAGFWSKLLIIVALWVSGKYIYAILAVLASVVTLAYMLTLQRKVFFGRSEDSLKNVKEARFGLTFPSIMLALIIIGVGIFFPFMIKMILGMGLTQ